MAFKVTTHSGNDVIGSIIDAINALQEAVDDLTERVKALEEADDSTE